MPTNAQLVTRYVKPHNKVSAPVTEKDLPVVIEEAAIMLDLCDTKHGNFPGAYAIAHPQINDVTPLRFFVLNDGRIICNPKMVRHTNFELEKEEGCLSFPEEPRVKVERYNKIQVYFDELKDDAFIRECFLALSGIEAEVWQHEIDHLNGKYIYKLN